MNIFPQARAMVSKTRSNSKLGLMYVFFADWGTVLSWFALRLPSVITVTPIELALPHSRKRFHRRLCRRWSCW